MGSRTRRNWRHDGLTLRRATGAATGVAVVVAFTIVLAPSAAAEPAEPVLVKQIHMHLATPPLPDAAGVAWMPGVDRLMVADSEVDEMPIYQGVNLWQITRTGPAPINATVTDTGTTYPAFSREPTGLGYIEISNTLLISSDSGGGSVFFDRPGTDGRFGTSDDIVTDIDCWVWGVTDCEDVAWDSGTGHLWIAGGDVGRVYDVDPVNGAFGDGNDATAVYDMNQYGGNDAEGIDVDPYRNRVVVADRTSRRLYEITKDGALIQAIDIRDFPDVRSPADVALAPSSNDPNGISYYVADRGVDNNQDPNENDGLIHEITLGGVADPPPTVTLMAPAEGSTVFGSAVPLTATATDNAGVTQVQFLDGATLVGTDTDGSDGWSVIWNTTVVPDGLHTVRATATDTAGQSASDANAVTVDNVDDPPSVTLTAPAEGSTVSGSGVPISAAVSDDGVVTRVEFFDGATSLGVDADPAGGWSILWDSTAVGDGGHVLQATATDDAAQTGTDSNAVSVDNSAPTVSITAPADGSTVSGIVSVQAGVTDNGTVASVQFFDGTTSIGTDTNGTDGWSVNWNTGLAGGGAHTLTARATDQGGNSATSAPVQVTVYIPQVIDLAIATGTDDVEENATGGINTTSTDLDMTTDGTAVLRAVGLRFAGVNVPQGVPIINAYVQFQADEASSEATTLTIHGQAVDNAPAFTSQNSNVTNRARTAASATWTPPAWARNAQGVQQRTSNLSQVIQEIVNRPGWVPGNALVLIITGSGRRVAESANSATFNPVLHVEFGPSDPPPTVTLTAPAEGATVSGSAVPLTATATDDAGVTQVQFLDGATLVGTDTDGTDGWSVSWNTTVVPDGPHTVRATATDTAGQSASDAHAVTVDNVDAPPSVSITSPAGGSTVGGTVTILASASDDQGVSRVEFFDGATSLGVDPDGSNGWSASWDTTAVGDGTHSLTATATDTGSHTTTSAAVSVIVDNSTPPPITQIQAKASDASAVTSLSLTYDQSPTQGNLLVAIGHYGANRVPTIPAGWSLALESNTGGETVVFYRVAGASESSTVTLSIGGAATFMSLTVFEYAGLSNVQSQVLDRAVFGSALNATSVSTGMTQTTSQANELLIASVGLNGKRTFLNTWTNGFVRQTSTRRQTVAVRMVSETGQFVTAESWDTAVGVSVGALVTFRGA